ncbi:DUF447 domain-containing protein [Natranaeroarchaeum sulfidigenes]|uniref:DIM6/NTAB family protein n=1 Tax=Natranaeroarchaeum sulfidigenes TaxID=2784880 RepID=A0A897MWY5_9EURY|nr:DUF447 domain-containing protein [Natranaeroarchaeum sulfidigenes]QSG02676.1 DIM6/NTAB family protein [Natranaeroarchaeum sulfidigenes]
MSEDGQSESTDHGEWPVDIVGVTESLVTTLGPNDLWNVAALGLHGGDPVTATTFGRTRTWRNFRQRGRGYVQFTPDPQLFVEAALSVEERTEPVLDEADAWAEVAVESLDVEDDGGARKETWAIRPVEGAVVDARPHLTNRGYYAVIEATVAASRLEIDAYDTATLVDRLSYFEEVVQTCGGPAEQAAFDRLSALVDWHDAV